MRGNLSLRRALAISLSILLFPISPNAFSFTNNSPTQCDDLTVQWTGGTPPFRLLMVPPGQSIRNISIPSTAFVNNAGSFTTQIPLAEHQRVMFSMSDATGISTGGTTTLYEVGASVSGNQCNVTVPTVDFFFSLDNDLQECKAFPFTQYPQAVQPVTIVGFIPSGQTFVLHPPLGDSFSWNPVNLTAGTSVAFAMSDSLGRDGGVAPIEVVQISDDTSCVSSSASPSGTSGIGGSSGTGSSSSTKPTGSTPSQTAAAKSKSNIGLIAGAAAGGAVLMLLLFLAIFCIRRRRGGGARIKHSKEQPDLLYQPAGTPAPEAATYLYTPTQYTVPPPPIPHVNGPPTTLSEKRLIQEQQQQIQRYSANDTYRVSTVVPPTELRMSVYPASSYASYAPASQPQAGPSRQNPTTEWTPEHLFSGNSSQAPSSQAPSSSDGRSSYPPPPQGQTSSQRQLIMHTDIAESGDVAEPMELPPQYVEGRAPIPGLVPSEPQDGASPSGSAPGSSKADIKKRGKR